jgi:hypothetical protein
VDFGGWELRRSWFRGDGGGSAAIRAASEQLEESVTSCGKRTALRFGSVLECGPSRVQACGAPLDGVPAAQLMSACACGAPLDGVPAAQLTSAAGLKHYSD